MTQNVTIIEWSRSKKNDGDDDFHIPKKGKYAGRNEDLRSFAKYMEGYLQQKTGIKASARGNAYLLEQEGKINKADFDWAEGLVLECIKASYLPVDFVKEDPARVFFGVEEPTQETPVHLFTGILDYIVNKGGGYTPNWWEGETYYMQMIVEKIDLVTLFAPNREDISLAAEAGIRLEPICQNYHIPIANAKGWSSVRQRAEFARRFKEAEEYLGLKSVLLYFGDHDPDGLRISDTLRANLEQIKNIRWKDGITGYDPKNLIIKRIGLNYDFIQRHNIPSIDNLITGSKMNLASPSHPNHNMPYVKDYIAKYGVRKWEAQALVTKPVQAQELCRQAIEDGFLGLDAKKRFKSKEEGVVEEIARYIRRCGAEKAIKRLLLSSSSSSRTEEEE